MKLLHIPILISYPCLFIERKQVFTSMENVNDAKFSFRFFDGQKRYEQQMRIMNWKITFCTIVL